MKQFRNSALALFLVLLFVLAPTAAKLQASGDASNVTEPPETSAETEASDKKKTGGGWAVVEINKGSGEKGIRKLEEGTQFSNWSEIAEAMVAVLEECIDTYKQEDESTHTPAYDLVNTAYFTYYETLGFEKATLRFMKNGRVTEMEAKFRDAKRFIGSSETDEKLRLLISDLQTGLLEDAAALDAMGKSVAGTVSEGGNKSESLFLSFTLVMREGLEAILVIAALIAYLVKLGHRRYLKHVYGGALLGVICSGLLAFFFHRLGQTIGAATSGRGQEIFEGVTMFLAVIVLFWVSNWMINKSEVEEWNRYIRKQVDVSITTGSVFALVFSAFLAVAREGAELVLFFQGIVNNQNTNPTYMWLGILLAAICLVVIFILFRIFSVKLPLKPFFYFTSIIMLILCFSFMGKGVRELQEADVIPVHHIVGRVSGAAGTVSDAFTFDFLGIYDRYETVIPQLIIVLLMIWTFVRHRRKTRDMRRRAQNGEAYESEGIQAPK